MVLILIISNFWVGYNALGSKILCKTLLKDVKEKLNKKSKPHFDYWDKIECMLICSEWSNTINRPLLIYCVYQKKEVFQKNC